MGLICSSRMDGAAAAAEQEMEENMQSVGGMLANLRLLHIWISNNLSLWLWLYFKLSL